MKLSGQRYEQIKNEVVLLFQKTRMEAIPVNAWLLADKLNIKLVKYSHLNEEQREAARQLCNGGMKFSIIDKTGISRQVVFYDDSAPLGRQRFSILHEIGHIVLGHKQDSELAEAEADFFAKFAIAPPMLVSMTRPSDYMDIAHSFGLSAECAYNSMSYYNKWLRIPGYKAYEHSLLELFTIQTAGGGRVLRTTMSA